MGKIIIVAILSVFSISVLSSFNSTGKYTEFTVCSISDTQHLAAYAIQTIPMGERCVIVLNKGTNHNVKMGDEGFIPELDSIKFRITEVYPTRSKATVNAEIKKSGMRTLIIIKKG